MFIITEIKEEAILGTPFNTAGWTSVEAAGQNIEKIGPILATKVSTSLLRMHLRDLLFQN